MPWKKVIPSRCRPSTSISDICVYWKRWLSVVFFVGVTDGGWFRYLAEQKPEEVNFWRPMARQSFRAVPAGAPFLFKLHKPNDYVVGGGFFTGYSRMPLTMAWEAFKQDNGAPDYRSFRESIKRYRDSRRLPTQDPEIGCIILNTPFFFEEDDWIPIPDDWAPNIVQGRRYDSDEGLGADLWEQVAARLLSRPVIGSPLVAAEVRQAYGPVFGNQYLRTARLGQGAFRLLTLENYGRKCCITGESTLPVLEAAHIRPVTQEGNHDLRNGITLRADMHILFDRGLLGIDPDYRIQVSGQIRDQYHNGQVYYVHEGEEMRSLPVDPSLRPDREALEWFMSEVFVA